MTSEKVVDNFESTIRLREERLKQNQCVVCGGPAKNRYSVIFYRRYELQPQYCSFAHGAKIHPGTFIWGIIVALIYASFLIFSPEFEDADPNRKIVGYGIFTMMFLYSLVGYQISKRVRAKEKRLIL